MTLDRALKLVVWAAKCHTHTQTSQMPLGRLPHTVAEVYDAIRVVEAHEANMALWDQGQYHELTHDTALGG